MPNHKTDAADRSSTPRASRRRKGGSQKGVKPLSKSLAIESLQWYRLIVENVRDFAIFSADINGNIRSWNPGAERFFGYKAHEILGKPMKMLYTPEDQAAGIDQKERNAAAEQGTSEDERWHVRNDGSRFFVFGRVNPMRTDQGALCGFIKIARDITARRILQEDLERAHTKLEETVAQRTASLTETVHELETFSYSLSHDMRGPLRAIQGFAEVVMTKYAQAVPEAGKELLHRIVSAAEQLDRMIKESLSFHRGPREPLPLEPTALEPILDALSLERPELAAPDVLNIGRPLRSVMAHPPSLAQALRNLLSNALRFVPPGQKPQISLWTESKDGQVRICVRDHGIGIAPADLERVWNLFTRLHPEKFPGTGVGLALVRKAIERMGGTTGVDSREGEGSLFWLQLEASPRS